MGRKGEVGGRSSGKLVGARTGRAAEVEVVEDGGPPALNGSGGELSNADSTPDRATPSRGRPAQLTTALVLLRAMGPGMGLELRWSDRYREVQVRWSGVRGRRLVERPGGWIPFDDGLLLDLRTKLFGGSISRENAADAVIAVARDRIVDDVVEWLDALPPWDGEERCSRLFGEYFHASSGDEATDRAVSSTFCAAAVARAYHPGIRFNHCVVIQGAQQKSKTGGFRRLFGEFYGSLTVSLSNARAAEQVVKSGAWGIEMEELASLKKAEYDRAKAFQSGQMDEYFGKYERFVSKVPRAFINFGTVNESKFLADPTGAERYWVLFLDPKERVDEDGIGRDREQIWAEARERWRSFAAEVGEGNLGALERGLWLPGAARAVLRGVAEGVTRAAPWESVLGRILDDCWAVHGPTLVERMAASGAVKWDSVVVDPMVVDALKRRGYGRERVLTKRDGKVRTSYVWVREPDGAWEARSGSAKLMFAEDMTARAVESVTGAVRR